MGAKKTPIGLASRRLNWRPGWCGYTPMRVRKCGEEPHATTNGLLADNDVTRSGPFLSCLAHGVAGHNKFTIAQSQSQLEGHIRLLTRLRRNGSSLAG